LRDLGRRLREHKHQELDEHRGLLFYLTFTDVSTDMPGRSA
jgi:hypothetical protein